MWLYVYESMASPQLENGYTRIANELLEHLISCGLNGGELAMCILVIRKTYGYGKKWDIISLSQLQQGLQKSHWYVSKLKKMLVSSRLLLINKNALSINKNWEEWVVSNRTSSKQQLTGGSKQQNNQVVSSSLHTKETIKKTFKERKNLSVNDYPTLLLTWGESRRGRKYAQPAKQRKHIESMLKVGWTPQEIQEKYEFLEEDKYWGDRGIDFAIVSSQLDKEKTKQGESLLWDN